jgi:hypothetical protein
VPGVVANAAARGRDEEDYFEAAASGLVSYFLMSAAWAPTVAKAAVIKASRSLFVGG